MKKFRLNWDKEKEEMWLNQMAQEGWALTGFFMGVYSFEACKPGEYLYQIDLLSRKKRARNEFREVLREQNIEIVEEWYQWVYLKKRADEGAFDQYTDSGERIWYYKKYYYLFAAVFLLELICMAAEVGNAVQSGASPFRPFTLLFALLIIIIGSIAWRLREKIKSLKESKIF